MNAREITKVLRKLGNPDIAKHSQRFFKTGKGEYGEGDQFVGIRVPVLRKQVKNYVATPISEILHLLSSSIHEERLFALLLLVHKFTRADEGERKIIYDSYLSNTKYVNNWDLVDSSAMQIVGGYLEKRNKQPLYQLAKSHSLWERRIAIISTFHFIKSKQFKDTLEISELLLKDEEDLIHKAVGWMLREIGKRDVALEKSFLKIHYQDMPRTMLRYAIEKFPDRERLKYLKGIV